MSNSPQSEDEDNSRMRDKFRKERNDGEEEKKGTKRHNEDDKKDEFGRSVREKDRDRERRDKDRRSPREGRRHSPRGERRPSNARERGHSPPYKRERREEMLPDWDAPPGFHYPRPFVPIPPPMHRGPYPDPMAFAPPDQRRMFPPRSASKGRTRSQDMFEGPLKTYKQFLETQDDNITPHEAEKKYDEYKGEFKKKQARTFFREHKAEEWFREKYDPPYLERHKTERDAAASAKARQFAQLFTDGTTKFCFDADSHLEEGEQIEEEEEEGEEGENQEDLQEEDISQEEKDGEEEDIPKADKHEEATTPTGEDAQAKMVSTKPPNQRKNDKLDMALEPQKRGMEPPRDPNTLFIKTVTPTCSRAELLEVLNRVGQPGEQVCTLLLSEPMRYKNFHRIGWVTYKTHELCLQALRELNNHKFKDFELQMTINRPNTPDSKRRFKVTPENANNDDRIAHDLDQAQALMQKLDSEKCIENNALLSFPQWSELSTREKLDRVLFYLRYAHFFCYYCGEEFEDEDDLRRRCGTVHVRGKPKKIVDGEPASSEKGVTWAENIDKKINARLTKVIDPEVYTGKELVSSAMEEVYQDSVKKLEDEKYRCSFCNKLFRGDEFVRKHINLKHDGPLKEAKQKGLDEQFFQNYWNDPRHILPTSTQQQQAMSAQGGGLLHHAPQHKHNRRQTWEYSQPEPAYVMRMPLPPPVVLNPRGGRGGSFRGSGRPSPVRGRPDPRPYPPPGRPLPPPAGFQDPRGIREYVDLDAPADDLPQIDYRTGLSSDQS